MLTTSFLRRDLGAVGEADTRGRAVLDDGLLHLLGDVELASELRQYLMGGMRDPVGPPSVEADG